jgi:hypothetical protein
MVIDCKHVWNYISEYLDGTLPDETRDTVQKHLDLQDHSVEDELLRRHYVLLRADLTRYDPEITSELSRLGRSGVPTYVITSGSNKETTHVLPELLTRGVVLDAIRKAGTQQDSQIQVPPAGTLLGER